MQASDLDYAVQLAQSVHWVSQDRVVFQAFLDHPNSRCYAAEMDGVVIGTIAATNYGSSGFLGELIVREEHRGQGLGRDLLMHAVDHLRSLGVQSIYLDGAAKAIPLYERNGFQRICASLRFDGWLPPENHASITSIQASELPEIVRLDLNFFGADRSFFLRRRWELSPHLCLAIRQHGRITGYLFSRRHADGLAVGPWVVEPSVEDPLKMLSKLSFQSGNAKLHLGVLESNALPVKLLRDAGFKERDEVPWRMVLGKRGTLGENPVCFAVGSPAKG